MSEKFPILQIVPRLGKLNDGVADYARTLGAELDANEQIQTSLLCGDPGDSTEIGEWQARTTKVAVRSSNGVVSALEEFASRQDKVAAQVVLLHYVCYGYATRGCPFWLIQGLNRWKQRNPGARLITIFHELYAFGPPWRSSFWLSPVQRYLAREIWKITDAATTSLWRYKSQLNRWLQSDDRPIAVMPVFSNFPEPQSPAEWSSRAPYMVVFGPGGSAARTYEQRRVQLLSSCRALEIEHIWDIGPRDEPPPQKLENVRIEPLGWLPAAEVSRFLANARAGFLDYPSDLVAKSTIFAAYAAHGVVPIIPEFRGDDECGPAVGVHYWSPNDVVVGVTPHFGSIAANARKWYAAHRLEVQVKLYARMLKGQQPGEESGT